MRNCDGAYGMFVAATEVAAHEGTIIVNVGATMLQPGRSKSPNAFELFFTTHPSQSRWGVHARRPELETIQSIQLRQRNDSGFKLDDMDMDKVSVANYVRRSARLVAANAAMILIAISAQSAAAGSMPVIRSSGCDAAPPPGAPTALNVEGAERPLLVIIGERVESTPHDLVIAFHGRTNSNAEVRAYYDLERHALRPTVFVYPTGLPTEGGSRSWNRPGDPVGGLRDYELFDVIVLKLARLYCIDLGRVFAVGHSLGASFVNNLACARGGKLRGIASVAGDIGAAECRRPVAAILFHSPKDQLVSIARGEAVRDRLLDVNGLHDPPAPLPSSDLNCVRYGAEDAAAPVVWCAHSRTTTRRGNYYPHQWPREAGMLIMAFFASLP